MIRRFALATVVGIIASSLGKHGNQTRRERERERVRATAREMRRQLGLPPAKALER